MPADYIVSNRQKPLVRTIGAFDSRLFANPSYPLVRAHRRIPHLAGLATLKSAWIDIITSSEERTEECDLILGRRELIHNGFVLHLRPEETRKLPHIILAENLRSPESLGQEACNSREFARPSPQQNGNLASLPPQALR